tara:strand:- start:334 stop:522 length:189 start_codon:yes stop_codon:yes gene_type:complete
MKFVFLLTIWASNSTPTVYVVDYGLTGKDCIRLLTEYKGDRLASCEVDMGILANASQLDNKG